MSKVTAIMSGAEPVLLPQAGIRASLRRIGALVVRYNYLLRKTLFSVDISAAIAPGSGWPSRNSTKARHSEMTQQG